MRSSSFQSLRNTIAFILTCAFLAYEMGLQSSVGIIAQDLMRDLGIHAGQLGMLLALYFYTYTIMQIPCGMLFDRFSLRWVASLACLVCTVGVGLSAQNHVSLQIIGRAMMGAGSACAFVGVLTVIDRCMHQRFYAFLVGITQLLAAFGAAMGEGPFASWLALQTWQSGLWQLAIVGLILAVLMALALEDKNKMHDSTTQSPWRSLGSIMLKKQNWLIACIALNNWAPVLIIATLWGVPFLNVALHMSKIDAGNAMILMWLGVGITSPLIGAIADKTQQHKNLIMACNLLGIISGVMFIWPKTNPWLWLTLLGCASAGQIITFALIKKANNHCASTAVGFCNMGVVAGGIIFQPLTGFILNTMAAHHHTSTLHYQAHDYATTLAVVPICYSLALIATWRLHSDAQR